MKKNMIRITLAALALAAIGSAQSVTYNFARDVDFSKLKSYKWVEIPGGVRLDDITAKQRKRPRITRPYGWTGSE